MTRQAIPQRRILVGLLSAALTFLLASLVGPTRASAATELRVSHEQWVLIPVPVHQSFDVVQALDVVNGSPSNQDVVIDLPAGATGFQATDKSLSVQEQGHTVTLHNAAKAGKTSSISVSYTLPFDSAQGAQFTLHSNYAVDTAQLYLPTGQYALSAEDLLTTTQTTDIQGTQFRIFSRLGIPAGDDWTVSVQQLPSTASAPSLHLPVIGAPLSDRQNLMQAAGNLLMALIVLLVGLLGIKSTQYAAGQRSKSRTEALIRALEHTELEYALGHMDDDAYTLQKQDLLARLAQSAEPLQGGGAKP